MTAPRIGDLVETPKGWAVTAPTHCPQGHRLGPGRSLVGNQPCGANHGGHLSWTCVECDQSVYSPPVGSACRMLHGPAGIRNV